MAGGRASLSLAVGASQTPSSTILRNGTFLNPSDTSSSSFPNPTESWTTFPEHEGPPFTTFSETATAATGSESVASSEPTSYVFSSSSHSNRGEVVAAAVGGSLGALIAVSLGLCFLWATRRRRQSHHPSSQRSGGGGGWGPTRAWVPFASHSASASTENLSPSPFTLQQTPPPSSSSVEQRFAALESELASLRAEVVRLRSTPGGEREMEQGFVSRGPSLIYAHTKADEAYRDPSRTRPGSGASVETEKTGPPLYVD